MTTFLIRGRRFYHVRSSGIKRDVWFTALSDRGSLSRQKLIVTDLHKLDQFNHRFSTHGIFIPVVQQMQRRTFRETLNKIDDRPLKMFTTAYSNSRRRSRMASLKRVLNEMKSTETDDREFLRSTDLHFACKVISCGIIVSIGGFCAELIFYGICRILHGLLWISLGL